MRFISIKWVAVLFACLPIAGQAQPIGGGAATSVSPGITILNPTIAGGKLANSVVLDGTYITSLSSAIAALPSTGGNILVVPGYTETMSADITLTKPMVHITFLGPATITMGSHVITTGGSNTYPSISGFSIDGPVRGSNDVQVAGMPGFVYTGTGSAITLGASNTDVYGINLSRFYVDISGAGTAAKGIVMQQVHEVTFDGVEVHGVLTSGKTQVCVDSLGSGTGSNFNSYQLFKDVFIYGCTTGYLLEGSSDANNGNTWVGGSISTNTTDGVGIFISVGDSNNILNTDSHDNHIGLEFGATALHNIVSDLRLENNTTDIQFNSGATLNGVYTNVVPVVVDNSGVGTNWALPGPDKPTINAVYTTTTASSGNIQTNLQPRGIQAPAGLYRLSVYVEVTTVATGGTYGVQALYTDDAQAETLQMIPAGTSLTAKGLTQATAVIRTNGTVNIAYKVAVSGITGTPSYTSYAVLERLN